MKSLLDSATLGAGIGICLILWYLLFQFIQVAFEVSNDVGVLGALLIIVAVLVLTKLARIEQRFAQKK